jgi:hypothetical protein
MEYIKVTFDPRDIRDVLANGNRIGATEKVLMVPTNFYTITLSGEGYTPPSWKGLVDGTLPTAPLVIVFATDGDAGENGWPS